MTCIYPPIEEFVKADTVAGKRQFGSVQFNVPLESETYKLQRLLREAVDPGDLGQWGVEEEPHITLRYGLEDDNYENLIPYLHGLEPFEVDLVKVDSFPASEQAGGDVPLIIALESVRLHQVNTELEQQANYKPSDFAAFRPHMTIAYVKAGTEDEYKNRFGYLFSLFTTGKTVLVDRAVISPAYPGEKQTIPFLGGGLVKFDPDQPRDERGRWGEGGSVGSAIAELNEKYPVNPENPEERVLLVGGKPVVAFQVAERDGRLRLKEIRALVPKSGAGSLALHRITNLADRHGVRMELTASPHGANAMSHEKLISWYQEHGFKHEAGFDPSLNYMVREPKATKLFKVGKKKKTLIVNPATPNPVRTTALEGGGLAKFDPDEPRDEYGRWGTGGGVLDPATEFYLRNGLENTLVSKAEAEVLAAYKESSSAWNNYLRGERGGDASNPGEQQQVLDKLFARAPETKEPMTVYRGFDERDAKVNSAGFIVDKSWLSTTKGRDIAEGFALGGGSEGYERQDRPALLQIRVPEGSRVIAFKNDHQREVLLPRGAKIKLVGVDRSNPELLVYTGEYFPSKKFGGR